MTPCAVARRPGCSVSGSMPELDTESSCTLPPCNTMLQLVKDETKIVTRATSIFLKDNIQLLYVTSLNINWTLG